LPLADRLKKTRESRRMTAARLAAAAGVSRSFISQLESGRTSASLATLTRLAAALDVPTGVLLLADEPVDDGQARQDAAPKLLYGRDTLSTAPSVRVLSETSGGVLGVVSVPRGGFAATGYLPRGGRLFITGLRGSGEVQVHSGSQSIGAGEVAIVEHDGDYRLLNEGAVPAVLLLVAASIEQLPRISLIRRQELDSPRIAFPASDNSGAMRLVNMRARRAAERAR